MPVLMQLPTHKTISRSLECEGISLIGFPVYQTAALLKMSGQLLKITSANAILFLPQMNLFAR